MFLVLNSLLNKIITSKFYLFIELISFAINNKTLVIILEIRTGYIYLCLPDIFAEEKYQSKRYAASYLTFSNFIYRAIKLQAQS